MTNSASTRITFEGRQSSHKKRASVTSNPAECVYTQQSTFNSSIIHYNADETNLIKSIDIRNVAEEKNSIKSQCNMNILMISNLIYFNVKY